MSDSRRSERGKKPTEKVLLYQQERAEEAGIQADAERKRAERARRAQRQRDRAEGIDIEATAEDERQDSIFTSRAVVSKPTVMKQLAQRASKVPLHHAQDLTLEDGIVQIHDLLDALSHHSILCPSPCPTSTIAVSFPYWYYISLTKSHHWKQTVPPGGNGRPKASDYNEVEQDIIALANRLYRCLLSTQDGFPETVDDILQIKKAWDSALKIKALDPVPLSPRVFKIIRSRNSQLRGEAKSKMALLVGATYGFNSGNGRKTITANRNLAESLKHEGGFVYKGLYRNPIIQKGINVIWFRNKFDEGIEFSDMFDPIPIEAIAFVLTAVEAAIDEWATGTKTDIPFKADEYRQTYRAHFRSLREYGTHTAGRNLLPKLCQKLYDNGRDHAGAPPRITEDLPAIPESAFEAAMEESGSDSDEEPEGADN
ncbi:hypothetical protein BD779DRAFT_1468650 [Infundibulicybe gibba]|nr:hypothetical protein BD779DRAFT_1468650 [Infundibulicybe gibba]